MTAPSQVACEDVLRVWREAGSIPQIEHAGLFDHLMPVGATERALRARATRTAPGKKGQRQTRNP